MPTLRTSLHSVDVHVGLRIRTLRRERDRSQVWLAEQLGMTFQQVQKYERGTNRVSASVLYAVATALGVTVATLYEGLPDPAGVEPPPSSRARYLDRALSLAGTPELLEHWCDLPTNVRAQVGGLVATIASAQPGARA